MSTKLQLLAAAALGATYLEARTLFIEDFSLIKNVLICILAAKRDVYFGQVNFFYVIERLAKSRPNDVGLIYPKQVSQVSGDKPISSCFEVEKYTFSQIYNIVLQYARILHDKYGVNHESTVALDCTNKPQFIFAWFAIWSLGATPAFINYNLTSDSLVHCVKTANSNLLLVDNDYSVLNCVDPVRDQLQNIPIVVMNNDFEAIVANAAPLRVPDSERHPEHKDWNAASYVYTSGTTGLPKAAIIPWAKYRNYACQFGCVMKYSSSDTFYTSMPLYHGTASVLGVAAALGMGVSVAIGHKFSTSTFWTQVKLSGATVIQYVGETGRYLVTAPKSPDERDHKVRLATGNGMRSDIWLRFKERFNIPVIGEFFASTEGPFATTNYQVGDLGVGAVGKYGSFLNWLVLNYRQVVVKVDPEALSDDGSSPVLWRDPKTGFCCRTKTNEAGELLTRIPNPQRVHESFQGYHGDKKSTSSKVITNVFRKGDAYYRSGDLLKFDKDGFLHFVDRMGDTFRWKSENVATNEVEHVAASFRKDPSDPFSEGGPISQAVVVGVTVPCHEGRAGFAVIQLSNGSTVPDETFISEFGSYLLSQLPRYAVPVFVKFVPSIERTGNFKVVKKLYREQKFGKERSEKEEGTIYWLKAGKYVPLENEDWDQMTAGKVKL